MITMSSSGRGWCPWVFKITDKRVVIGLSVVILTSCVGGSNRAPIRDNLTISSNDRGYHIVSKGETLFSIAWRYDLEYKLLAKRNGISSSYIIHPGQKIYLYKSIASSNGAPVKKMTPTASVRTPPVDSSSDKSRSKSATAPKQSRSNSPLTAGELVWRWPSEGKVIETFSSSNTLNKGIDIEGRLGEPVLAAGPGVVVYAGDGIRGYGNLLIIKHNEIYLSAYAHNSKILVKEKQVVKAGEKIAEIGRSGTDKTGLHFEIRREGKPIDPRLYLPRR